MLGRKIKEIYNGHQPAGEYTCQWNAMNQDNQSLSSGVYFLRIQAENYKKTAKMMYIR